MKFERAFATVRIAGDNLVPDKVTDLLGAAPTLAYAKGQSYKRSPNSGELIGKTGVWYYSTERFDNNDLAEHAKQVLSLIASDAEKRTGLKELLERNSLRAVVTFFWAGPAGATAPEIPGHVIEKLESIPLTIERDFDTDYEPSHREPIFQRAR
jgi:hypothetical protein